MSEVITAIICTHNRDSFLDSALSSLTHQSISKSLYEILVVDNCSTDSTAEVVKKFSSKYKVRYLYEPRLGLSNARNTGWLNAKGKYAAYLDDDAVAEKIWLEKTLEAFEKMTPMPGCVGGRITGIWEASRPAWLSDELVTGLTVLDWSDEPLLIKDLNQKWLAGANIAFSIEVLKKIGGFVSSLDRVGKNLLSGGDVFIQKQIVKEGYNCLYYPDMAVRHHIPKARLTQKWFIPRYFWQGISDAVAQIIEQEASPAKRLRLAIPLAKKIFKQPKIFSRFIFPTDNPKQFTRKCFDMIAFGHILGLLYRIKMEK